MGTLGKPQNRQTLETLLTSIKLFADVIPCGSYRRGFQTCNDLDIATVTPDGTIPEIVFERMAALGFEILAHGKKQGRFLLAGEIQVDWYATTADKIGALMLHLTGSAEFNVGFRGNCKSKNLSFSENGLVNRDTKELLASKTEEDIFNYLGFKFIPPAERTNFYRISSKYKL